MVSVAASAWECVAEASVVWASVMHERLAGAASDGCLVCACRSPPNEWFVSNFQFYILRIKKEASRRGAVWGWHVAMRALPKLLLALAGPLATPVTGCTTLAVGRRATNDGSVLSAHSNDGNGDVAANLVRVPAASWPAGASRAVSGGEIPQVQHTYSYFTKPGGYAALNEWQVGLAESTCVAVYAGNASVAKLNIVDLSAIALERAKSAVDAVRVMGALAELHGYNDNGESLIVSDPNTSYLFQILPDPTQRSAVWAAQRVPEDHVAAVANSFTIREVNLSDTTGAFMFSRNLPALLRQDRDFTRSFAGAEFGHKYSSGRRVWRIYSLLAPETPFSAEYGDLIRDAPYPATVRVKHGRISLENVTAVMRDYYQNTPYDMATGLAAGPFGTPSRWAAGPGEAEVGPGWWERTIATYKSILSYVVQLRGWLPNDKGGVLWFAPHAAHTSVYVPFPLAVQMVPEAYSNNSFSGLNRSGDAFNAARFVHNVAQIKFKDAIQDIRAAQADAERRGRDVVREMDAMSRDDAGDAASQHAMATAKRWWDLSDELVLKYADGYCNGCGSEPRNEGYPAWWLRLVNYSKPLYPPARQPVRGDSGDMEESSVSECIARRCKRVDGDGRSTYDGSCVDACLDM